MKTALLAAALALGFAVASPAALADTASINGLDMYYEVHGEGEPIVLLHGAYMTIENNWAAMIPTLAKDHQVIAVELQGHGRTTDRDTPMTYENMAADVAGLLDHLKIEKTELFGYSMGGAAAVRFAIDYPERVTRIVAASAGYIYNEEVMGKDYFKMIASITPEMFANTPFDAEYKRLSPNPEKFPVLVDKLKQLDVTTFDWSADFQKISVPSLYIFGDADIVGLDYIAAHHKAAGGLANGDMAGLPKTQLLVLPGASHTGVFFNPANVEIMKAVVPTFLKQELPAKPSFPG